MKFDLSTQDPPADMTYDLVVVGSGPAGTTLARELSGRGLTVCVLESGRTRRSDHGERLKAVESLGIRIKEYSRERVLGGASTTWAGLSSPFDPVDFQSRAFLTVPGWPISREQLMPYYEEASARYRFGQPEAFRAGGFAQVAEKGDLRPRFERLDEKVFLAAVPPQNFAREHKDLWEREDIHLYLDATVTGLESDAGPESGARVAALRVATSSGRRLLVRGRHVVLCAGGIENARLLLVSRDARGTALGNAHDQVGRYLMNHPKNYHGILHLNRPVRELPYFFGCVFRGFAGYAGLRLTEAEQRSRGLLNSYVRMEPLFAWSDNPGVESLVLIAKRMTFFLKRFLRTQGDQVVTLRDYSETGDDSELQNARKGFGAWLHVLWNVVRHSPSVLAYLYFRLSRRAPRIRRVRIRNFLEMEPVAENRVTLSERTDPYGTPLPRVQHACTERDQRSLVELHEVLKEEFAQSGLGRLESHLEVGPNWPIDQDASHHMGTTRMGTDPRTSVVDSECRVHGVKNLWIAGASVLPTSGCANPTYTLVALAIRLARRLETELTASGVRP